MKKLALAATALAVMGGTAFAQETTPPDFSTLTGAVDYSTVITAIMTIAAGLVGVYLAMAGARLVLSMLRRS